jgi:hypothetical protein
MENVIVNSLCIEGDVGVGGVFRAVSYLINSYYPLDICVM